MKNDANQTKESAKLPYNAPKLTEYGRMRELTLQSSNANSGQNSNQNGVNGN